MSAEVSNGYQQSPNRSVAQFAGGRFAIRTVDKEQDEAATKKKLEDKRPETKEKEALQAKLDETVMQRAIDIGWEPETPNDYRNNSRSVGNGVSAPYGGAGFADGNKNTLYTSNENNFNSLRAALTFGTHADDHNDAFLFNRAVATGHSPEVDHIVESAAGGANSLSNGRILSKYNNGGGGVPDRPGRGDQELRSYQNMTIRLLDATAPLAANHITHGLNRFDQIERYQIAAGDELTNRQVKLLESYRNYTSAGATAKNNINRPETVAYHGEPVNHYAVDGNDPSLMVEVT